MKIEFFLATLYTFLFAISLILFYPIAGIFIYTLEFSLHQLNYITLLDFVFEFLHKLPGSSYLLIVISLFWKPILLFFVLPCIFILFLYVTAFMVNLFHYRPWFRNRYYEMRQSNRLSQEHKFEGPLGASIAVPLPSVHLIRQLIAAIWDIHGKIFHGYEIIGFEKLPRDKPSFVVYYHGTVPIDVYHFMARCIVERDICPTPVVDRFFLKVPGLQSILTLVGATSGTVESLSEMLSESQDPEAKPNNNIVLIGPGGVREALFSDNSYSVLWKNRRGFAKVAQKSNQPIYPMFTENIREPIRVVQCGKKIWWRFYELTRLPLAMFYGYFPVKLRTYVGDPIYPIEGESCEEMARRVRESVQNMIKNQQTRPGNILRALFQRIPIVDSWLNKNV